MKQITKKEFKTMHKSGQLEIWDNSNLPLDKLEAGLNKVDQVVSGRLASNVSVENDGEYLIVTIHRLNGAHNDFIIIHDKIDNSKAKGNSRTDKEFWNCIYILKK